MSDVRESIMKRVQDGDVDGVDASEFALSSPKAVIKEGSSGGSVGGNRATEAPEKKIEDFREIADTDPHVNEAIGTLVDYLVGSGFNVQPANIPGTDTEQKEEDIANLKKLIETSSFETVLHEWVWHALVDGTGFLEIVVEDDVFKPKVLPTERMKIQTDEYGNVEKWILEPPGGGGGGGSGGSSEIEFNPGDLAILRFHKHPGEDFGHSLLESCHEQADMLRDMEIDMARFVATKAYPPIVWKLGSEDRPWTQDQIDAWLEELENIDPESQLAVGHDVEHQVVGVSDSSSSQGVMKLEGHFTHLQQRIAAGLGVPDFFLNMGVDVSQGTAQVEMPKFDRRIQRYRAVIRQAVRHQVFVSILAGDGSVEDYSEVPPDFEFGQHSSEEERLEADKAIKLLNNGLITPKAAARKLDIDPETELPDIWEGGDLLKILQQLASKGDKIQNPDGGSPTDTGGGTDSAGGEVKTREKPASGDSSGSDSRNQQDVTNE